MRGFFPSTFVTLSRTMTLSLPMAASFASP